MRMSNKPTRGIPLTEDEKIEGERLRRSTIQWFGGARFYKTPSYGKPKTGNSTRKRQVRGRSDFEGGNIRRKGR